MTERHKQKSYSFLSRTKAHRLMKKGYLQMAAINRGLAEDFFFVEEEATVSLENYLAGSEHLAVRRGDIYFADLSPVVGSEEGGIRPVLVVQNDVGNRYSPTVIVVAITAKIEKAKLPTHVELKALETGLTKDSVILAEQIRTIDKKRLQEKITELPPALMDSVSQSICVSLGLLKL